MSKSKDVMPGSQQQEVKPHVVITDWAVVYRPTDPWTPPECRYQCLNGRVQNHPNHEAGKIVTTSPIKARRGQLVLTESGSIYELGEIRTEYEQQFPNAKERLLATLPVA